MRAGSTAPLALTILAIPLDLNQLAKAIVDQATGDAPAERAPADGKNPADVELGRRGEGNAWKSRVAKCSAKKCSEIARRAAKTG